MSQFKIDPQQEERMRIRPKPSPAVQIEYLNALHNEERAKLIIENFKRKGTEYSSTSECNTAAVLFFSAYSCYRNALQGYVTFTLEYGLVLKSDDIECAEFICRKATEMALNVCRYMSPDGDKEKFAMLHAEKSSRELYVLASYIHSLTPEDILKAHSKYQYPWPPIRKSENASDLPNVSKIRENITRLERLGDDLRKNDNYDYAAKWYRKAANLAKNIGDEESKTKLLTNIVEMYTSAALDLCAEVNNNASSIKPDPKYAYPKAMEYFLRAANVSESDLGDIKNAINLRAKAAKIAQRIINE